MEKYRVLTGDPDRVLSRRIVLSLIKKLYLKYILIKAKTADWKPSDFVENVADVKMFILILVYMYSY